MGSGGEGVVGEGRLGEVRRVVRGWGERVGREGEKSGEREGGEEGGGEGGERGREGEREGGR